MYKNNNQKGFTLIELLVVIAIIGLLSSVVLASLNGARNKGADAAIKSDLRSAQSQAELFYDDTNNTYTGLCANTTVAAQMLHAKNASSISGAVSTTLTTAETADIPVCHVSGTGDAYALSIALKTDKTKSWCVDSTGASQLTVGGHLAASDVTCN
ncbi:MAG: type II secretion system protein [bacterium]|nr:type II secretion system protein [bacterium]